MAEMICEKRIAIAQALFDAGVPGSWCKQAHATGVCRSPSGDAGRRGAQESSGMKYFGGKFSR